MVRGGPVGVSGKRGARGWGFDAGQALGERLFSSDCCLSAPPVELTLTGIKQTLELPTAGRSNVSSKRYSSRRPPARPSA